jgi:hypothetical protein
MGKKQRIEVADRLAAIPADEGRVILATGKHVGEGSMTRGSTSCS